MVGRAASWAAVGLGRDAGARGPVQAGTQGAAAASTGKAVVEQAADQAPEVDRAEATQENLMRLMTLTSSTHAPSA